MFRDRRRTCLPLFVPLALGLILGPACASLPTKPKQFVTVTGMVSDQLGRPLVGVVVYFEPRARSVEIFYGRSQAVTDSAGSYALNLLPSSWDVYFRVPSIPGYLSPRRVIEINAQHDHFNLTFDAWRVTGRVLDPTGSTLEAGSVSASGSEEFIYATSEVKNGVFSLLLPPGTYNFHVSPPNLSGFPGASRDGISVDADTTIEVDLLGDPITGTVFGPTGSNPEDFQVTAFGAEDAKVQTGPGGAYTLYVPSGQTRFFVDPGSTNQFILPRVSGLLSLTGPGHLDFDLSGVEWTGTVRSSTTGDPIAGAQVYASMFADEFGRRATCTTDGAGAFRLVLEAGHEYSLVASGTGLQTRGIFGTIASPDTTFDITLDPLPTP